MNVKLNLLLVLTPFLLVSAQDRLMDPYSAYECANQVNHHNSTGAIRTYLAAVAGTGPLPNLQPGCDQTFSVLRGVRTQEAAWDLFLAELMKGIGRSEAAHYYEMAAGEDVNEAAHRFFYGEYLRNFRGPQEPLYPQAEAQYWLARQILDKVTSGKRRKDWDDETESRLVRSLVALRQKDGLPLFMRTGDTPLLSLTSVFRFAKSNADLDRTSDIRDYTAAAAYAASRKGAPLTNAEAASLIRLETPIDTFDRLRFRYKDAPAIDFTYNFRHTDDVAPTVYLLPFSFNRLQLSDWEISAAKPFTIGNSLDVVIEGGFLKAWRKGLIEYQPDTLERITQERGRVAVSQFVGRDKFNASMVYIHQAIDEAIAGLPQRERRILAPTLSYQFFRPSTFSEHFQTRGIEVFGGSLLDRETYPVFPGTGPDTRVWRRDFFGGVTARGLAGGRWDVTLQPTFFSSTVRPDGKQDNSQYRTNAVVLYRIVDEERTPGLPDRRNGTHLGFLHLVFPVRHDIAREGIPLYVNYKVGAEVDSMWYTTARGSVTFLGSIRYDFQRFYTLNRDQNLLTLSLSMGF